MAGDCPHRSQLENTLKHCQEQTAVIAATHENYLTIIDELKTELDSISCQVTMVQEEFSSDQEKVEGSIFEKSLHELSSQNDMLQQALEQTTKEHLELKQNNDNLKGQIEHMQRIICDKEQRIAQLNAMLTHLQLDPRRNTTNECYSYAAANTTSSNEQILLRDLRAQLEDVNRKNESLLNDLERSQKQERFLLSETRKLNDELIENKRKNGDLTIQTRRLAALLKTQESHRMELSKKYEILEENYEDQTKKLRAASTQLNTLQDRLNLMEKRYDEHVMERNLLRDEVLSLKEKEATLLGRHKSIEDQLVKTEKELYTAHDVIKEQQCIMQRNEMSHAEGLKRSQDINNELKRQLNGVVEKYKRLDDEYQKQIDIQKQNALVIESFRKWKGAQVKADEATKASFNQFEEHIKLLLEEKQKFLEQYRELHRDYSILQSELDRLKMCSSQRR